MVCLGAQRGQAQHRGRVITTGTDGTGVCALGGAALRVPSVIVDASRDSPCSSVWQSAYMHLLGSLAPSASPLSFLLLSPARLFPPLFLFLVLAVPRVVL